MDNNYNTNNPFEVGDTTYNPYGSQPVDGYTNGDATPRKTKKCPISKLLGFFLGIALMAFAIITPLRFGLFSDGVISEIIEKSEIKETIKEEILAEKNITLTENLNKELDKTFDKVLEHVEDTFVKGEVPEKEVLKEDMNEAYDAIYDAISKDILDELQAKGELSIDEIKNLEVGKMVSGMLGEEEYDKLTEELKVSYGNTINVSEENRAEIEEKIQENKNNAEIKEELNKVVDDIHESLVELTEELTVSEDGTGISEILNEITSAVSLSFIIALVVTVVLMALIFVVDRNVGMTLRGFFAPLFVPGILVLLIGIAASKLFTVAAEEATKEVGNGINVEGILISMKDIIINPFIVVSVSMVVLAIVLNIVGTVLKKK